MGDGYPIICICVFICIIWGRRAALALPTISQRKAIDGYPTIQGRWVKAWWRKALRRKVLRRKALRQKAGWRKAQWLQSEYPSTMGDGYPGMAQWFQGSAAFQRIRELKKHLHHNRRRLGIKSELPLYQNDFFHVVPPHFFILKNFHRIYPDVINAVQCKTAKIAQASDSSWVNCTRLKLQIGSTAVQRGVNCTACNKLQYSVKIAQEYIALRWIAQLREITISMWCNLKNRTTATNCIAMNCITMRKCKCCMYCTSNYIVMNCTTASRCIATHWMSRSVM